MRALRRSMLTNASPSSPDLPGSQPKASLSRSPVRAISLRACCAISAVTSLSSDAWRGYVCAFAPNAVLRLIKGAAMIAFPAANEQVGEFVLRIDSAEIA